MIELVLIKVFYLHMIALINIIENLGFKSNSKKDWIIFAKGIMEACLCFFLIASNFQRIYNKCSQFHIHFDEFSHTDRRHQKTQRQPHVYCNIDFNGFFDSVSSISTDRNQKIS